MHSDTSDVRQKNSTELCALLASKICHDLISPIGGISSGIEVYDEYDGSDDEMQEEALILMRSSIKRSISLLTFARLAYGAGGTFDQQIDVMDAREVLDSLYSQSRSRLLWAVECSTMNKIGIKILVNLSDLIQEFAPRGGDVTLFSDGKRISVKVCAEKIKKKQELIDILQGESTSNIDARSISAYLIYLLCKENNGEIYCKQANENEFEFSVILGSSRSKEMKKVS